MDAKDLSRIRHYLGKTQDQIATLMGISSKAIQSFEQGWRDIPPYVERQLLLLLSLKSVRDEVIRPCWEVLECPLEWRENCAAWEFNAGNFCWLINGTFCHGRKQENWEKKIELCRECEMYTSMIPDIDP